MDNVFSVTQLDQFRTALTTPIPLDQVRGVMSLSDLWRCDEFIF